MYLSFIGLSLLVFGLGVGWVAIYGTQAKLQRPSSPEARVPVLRWLLRVALGAPALGLLGVGLVSLWYPPDSAGHITPPSGSVAETIFPIAGFFILALMPLMLIWMAVHQSVERSTSRETPQQ
jgi:hypothetical protein